MHPLLLHCLIQPQTPYRCMSCISLGAKWEWPSTIYSAPVNSSSQDSPVLMYAPSLIHLTALLVGGIHILDAGMRRRHSDGDAR